MKIWKAELILFYNDESKWETRFSFETDDNDYEINEKTKEWRHWKGWIGTQIPMNMKVSRTYCGEMKIVQGFDRELSEKELLELEQEMRKILVKKLNQEREVVIKKYEDKINAVLEEI